MLDYCWMEVANFLTHALLWISMIKPVPYQPTHVPRLETFHAPQHHMKPKQKLKNILNSRKFQIKIVEIHANVLPPPNLTRPSKVTHTKAKHHPKP